MRRIAKIAVVVLVATFAALPVFAARGTADFSRFVAIGDSYGAGFTGASLNMNHQVWSWPAVIARQAGLTLCPPTATAADNCFAQPLVSFPGIGAELQLVNLTPTITPAAGLGTPLMTTFGRPYNNLSVPGMTVGGALTLTGATPPSPGEPTPVTFSRFILRGLGTEVQQALAQNPTFIAVWIGGNDALAAVFAGTPAVMTSAADFKTRYETLINTLTAGAPNAGMVVGNIPNLPPPYALLVPPFIVNPATGQPVPGPDGKPIYYIADLGGGTIGQLPAGSLVMLHARAHLQTGFGFPPVPPFNALPDAGKPLPDSDVITPAELQAIVARIGEYNAAINQAASAKDIPVADIASMWAQMFAPGGKRFGPITMTAAPVTGGFFGLDFFHLTDMGYAVFANQFIRTINGAYDAGIPVAAAWQFFADNGAFFPETTSGEPVFDASGVTFTDAAMSQIMNGWATDAISETQPAPETEPTIPTPVRRRAAGH